MTKLVLDIQVTIDWQRAIECGVAKDKDALVNYMHACSQRINDIINLVFGEGIKRKPYVNITSTLQEVQ